MDELRDFPWPKDGTVLFAQPTERWSTACVNFSKEEGFYAAAYRFGAERLFEVVRQTGADQDFLVYPIVFLWRHVLELNLKNILPYTRGLQHKPMSFDLNHKLEPLWRECRPVLEEMHPESTQLLDSVGSIVEQFATVDPHSFAFRYPTDKQRRRLLPEGLQYINLRALHETMLGVDNFFGGVWDELDARLQFDREMEREYREDMAWLNAP